MTRRHLLVLATAVLAAMVMILPVATAGAAGNSTGKAGAQTVGPDFIDLVLNFNTAHDTFQYYVDVANATKPLKASTEDCCIANDKWAVVLESLNGANPALGTAPIVKTKAGTGSTTAFTGNLGLANPGVASFNGRALAMVYYARGVNTFPAGMTVRFSSDGQMTVTPRADGGP